MPLAEFPKYVRLFANYLRNRTQADGSDFGPRLVKIFEALDTPKDVRQTTLDQDLQAFPYINGALFEATIRTPDFTSAMRRDLLTAAQLDRGKVSPAIFGSMFQAVLDARADLYDPLTMPPALAKAHAALDRAVDRVYRKEPFETDADRVALLFARYQALVG